MQKVLVIICLCAMDSISWADSEIVDGIEWTYTSSYAEASVGSGNSSTPAVPKSTSGSIAIPERLGGKPVTGIGAYAFYNCAGLKEVVIPDQVKSIGNRAFKNCTSLQRVHVGKNVETVADESFYNCRSLSDITFDEPSRLTTIGEKCFSATHLQSVSFPDSLRSFARNAFSGVTGQTWVEEPDRAYWAPWVRDTKIQELKFGTNYWGCVYTGYNYNTVGDRMPVEYSSFRPTTVAFSTDYSGHSSSSDYSGYLGYSGGRYWGLGENGLPIIGFDSAGNPIEAPCNDDGTVSYGLDKSVDSDRDWCGDGLVSLILSYYSDTSPYTPVFRSAPSEIDHSRDKTAHLYIPSAKGIPRYVGTDPLSQIDATQTWQTCVWFQSGTDYGTLIQYRLKCYVLSVVIHWYGTWPLTIASTHGTPTPQRGTLVPRSYQDVLCSVDSVVPHATDPRIRYECTGWKGTGSVPATGTGTNLVVQVKEDSTLEWQWATNYLIECSISGETTARTASIWQHEGEPLVLPVETDATSPSVVFSGDAEGVVFDGENRTISIPADRPRSLHARIDSGSKLFTDKTLQLLAGGDSEWSIGEESTASDGYCLRSGSISQGETSTVEMQAENGGALSFDWKISANRSDWAYFYVDGVLAASITRATDWANVSTNLADGSHVLRWVFDRHAATAANDEAAFLDNVSWCPRLSLAVSSACGTPSPAAGTSIVSYGDLISASVVEPAPADGTRRVCTGWTGTGSVPAHGTTASFPFVMTKPSTLVWQWRTDRWIDLSVVSGGTTSFQPQWIENGKTVSVSVVPDTHLFRISLSGDTEGVSVSGTTITFVADRPRTIRVTVEEIKLPLSVESAHGFSVPLPGSHDCSWGDLVWCEVSDPPPENGVQYRCAGWRGTGSAPASGHDNQFQFRIEETSSIIWLWQTNVCIALETEGAIAVDIAEKWVERGSSLVVPYEPLADYVAFDVGGDSDGVVVDEQAQTITIPADRPRAVSVTATAMSLTSALDAEGLDWTTEGGDVWIPQRDVSSDGADAAASGDATGGDNLLETSVLGPGTLSWFWKMDASGWAGVDASVDGRDVAHLETSGDWMAASTQISGEGLHSVRFTFWTEEGCASSDRAYLDRVSWTGATIPHVTVTVTLDTQNGSGGTASVTGTYGSAMPAITVPTRTGYTFGGYYASAGGSGTQYYNAAGESMRKWDNMIDTTLYAKWTANTYIVMLDWQSGSGGTASVTATYDSAMPSITVPTRTGYTFGGYYTSAGGSGTQYYNAAGASARNWDGTADMTLYAKWTAKTATVTLDRQSGSGGTASVTATYDSAMPSITVPTRTGYTFGGYYTSAGGSGTQYYTAAGASARNWDQTAPTTLYAKWTAKTAIVTLDPQGGSGGTASVTATYDSAMPTVTVPTRTGYTFGGYYTSTGGSGTQYYTAAGASARSWNKTVAMTLFAKWTVKTATVTLDQQGGTGGTANVTATYGSAMPTIMVPTRAGYTFGGYYTSTGGSETQYYTVAGASARNWDQAAATTLYAKWWICKDWFVDMENGSDDNDGTSWVTAKKTLQAAIDLAQDGHRVFVADGTYAPITTDNKTIVIRSVNGAEKTFIDGGNSAGCAWLTYVDRETFGESHWDTELIGFTLQNGRSSEFGGAYGGTLKNCIIRNNRGGYYGHLGGGARAAKLHNCLVVSNDYNGVLHSTTYNCTIVDNGTYGAWDGQAYNCIIYGHSNAYPCMDAENRHPNCVTDNPGFVDYDNGDYHLTTTSPCVDTGANAYVGFMETDLDGNARIRNGAVDIGAFEYPQGAVGPYVVTLDRQSGSGGTASVTATYGNAMPTITVPTRTGYTFGGYYTSVGGSGTQYYTAAGASAHNWYKTTDMTLYAKWTAKTVAVTLDPQSGSGGMASVTATYGIAMPTITVPTRTGYTFGGYYTETGGSGTQYYTATGTSTRTWDKTVTTTLYAKWAAKTAIVTLDPQGGRGGESSVTVAYGSPMPAISVPVRLGCVFLGYFKGEIQYYDANGNGTRDWDDEHNQTLCAHWEVRWHCYVDDTGAVTITGCENKEGNLVIPGEMDGCRVTSIGHAAFTGCSGLASVTIPNSVTSIGDNAFEGCSGLASVTIPNSVTNIGDGVFRCCDGLAIVILPYRFKGKTSDMGLFDGGAFVFYSGKTAQIPNYKVDFNANGGVLQKGKTMSAQTMAYGKTAKLRKNVFTRKGYVFAGWATSKALAKKCVIAYVDEQSVANLRNDDKTTILYAVWAKPKFKVKFLANGGSGKMAAQTMTYGKAAKLTANKFKRKGCVFVGWAKSRNGAVAYTNCQKVKNLRTAGKTLALYACWAKSTYKVRFMPNGGTGTMARESFKYGTTKALSKNRFARSGYVFRGWSNRPNGKVLFPDGKKVKNLTKTGKTILLYAVWVRPQYTMRFIANGGSGSMADQGFTCNVPQALRANTFMRTGYTFAGWATSAGGSVAYVDRASISNLATADGAVVTLYAVWRTNTYTVRFNANGGSGSMADQEFAFNVAQALRANTFTRSGYTFAGWATSAGGPVAYVDRASVSNLASANDAVVTLYAVWRANTYTVRFNANGGSGSMADQRFTYNVEQALHSNGFTRRGSFFAGWATSANGSVAYSNHSFVSNLATDNDATVMLYAVWQVLSFSTGGNANWTQTSVDDGAIIQFKDEEGLSRSAPLESRWVSSTLSNGQSTWLETTIDGPGTVSFLWDRSRYSRRENFSLSFFVDGNEICYSDGSCCTRETVSVTGSGLHTLRWEYSKGSSSYSGEERGWVYNISWTPN